MLIKCSRCEQEKDSCNFYKAGIYFRRLCKTCVSEDRKRTTQTPEYKARAKVSNERWLADNPTWRINRLLKKKYGITYEDYKRMLADQGGKCGLCECDDPSKSNSYTKFFAVDHCHETGKVRGLLCFKCNIILGHAKDSPEFLQKAIQYLKR